MRTQLSVVVPTYMESENISELVDRIASSLAPLEFELVVVDDGSPDGTAKVAEALNNKYGNIKVMKRTGKLGLSSAVLEGFKNADAEVLAVMDADLQHPPEMLSKMYGKITEGYDLVVASRYVSGGAVRRWSLRRKIASKGASFLAHLFFSKTRNVKDVMSGFFMFKRSILNGVDLNPIGYKILLEILVKDNHKSLIEIPYVFEGRRKGRSNLTLKEIGNYIVHVYRLLRDDGKNEVSKRR